MKFKWKIFFLCMSIYMITLAGTSFIVTEDTFSSLLNKEIERALREEKNIHDSTILYLISDQRNREESFNVKDYSNTIIDMFSGEKEFIEIYDKNEKLVASNFGKTITGKREDLSRVFKEGRCYILRETNNINYLFITDTLKIQDNELIISYIKNIDEVYKQKKEQYFVFLKIGAVGLFFIAIIIGIMSNLIMRPVNELSKAAKRISSGSFKERVKANGKDEMANLGMQFNTMASEIERKIDELEQEGERKQRFIDNLTHELRTPLTSVIGYAELLQNVNYDKATFAKGLGYIHSEGKRMLKLISSLMDMIVFRENILNLEQVNSQEFLEEITYLLKIKAEKKSIELVVMGDNILINIDKDKIKEVILNLIDNSIKASSENHKIVVGSEIFNGYSALYVKDEGKGIEENELTKIIEPFYRIDKSRARKDGGVGLGLSICSEIVKKHEGELLIESKLNHGTKVSIILKDSYKGDDNIA